MNSIKRINSENLEIGQYVTSQTEGVTEAGLNAQGFIKREETLVKLQNSAVNEYYIDTKKGKDSFFALPIETKTQTVSSRVRLSEEKKNAGKVYKKARDLFSASLKNIKLGQGIDVSPFEDLAQDMNASIVNNPNALLCLSQIRSKDLYLLEHSINVGLLMGVFARFLGYDNTTVDQLTLGALLHDIGKIRVPTQVLNKPGKLNDKEWEEMRRHVLYGEEVLDKTQGISAIAKSVCSLHHEKLGGGGYPRNLDSKSINYHGRLASVVDIYDAISATRVYHSSKPPVETMKILQDLAGSQLDSYLVSKFMDCMGAYPVGSLVELSNGKLGVVYEHKADKPKQPSVRTFYNMRHGHYEKVASFDLSSPLLDLFIVASHDPNPYKIEISDFI